MIKKILLFSLIVISSHLVSGAFFDLPTAGNGNLKKELRNISEFNQIVVSGAFKVFINCQTKKKLEIEGDSNILPLIKTSVSKNILNITTINKYKENIPLNIFIDINNIKNVEFKGLSKVIINNLKNTKLNIISKGNNDLTVFGQTKEVFLNIMGAGYIDTKNLISEKAKVNLSGSSIVDVFSNKDLSAKISGFGKINYYGTPKNVKKEVLGAGLIVQAKSNIKVNKK